MIPQPCPPTFRRTFRLAFRSPSLVLVAAILVACGPSAVDREDGERAPLTSACGDPEEIRCLLPWPSSAFTRLDSTSSTGLRVEVAPGVVDREDDAAPLARADGFSRVTPLVFGFTGEPPAVEDLESAVWLVEAESGNTVPLHTRLYSHEGENLAVLWPRRPLAADTDHVVAVGDLVPATRSSLLALNRATPESENEAELRAYHAPSRRALARANLDLNKLSRVWDFTTRSRADVTLRVKAMVERARDAASDAEVVLDSVTLHEDSRVATVEGRLLSMPRFVPPKQRWTLGDDGLPTVVDSADVKFRVVLPAGEGDYPVSMWGHGLIGNVRDPMFDDGITELGLAKVAMTLHGWTGEDIGDTVAGLDRMFTGIDVAASRLAQGIADAAAIQQALAGAMGDALSASALKDLPNPAAGRRPDTSRVVWIGASLGAIVGALYSVLDDDIQAAALNVPGSGWTHIVPESQIFQIFAGGLETYRTPLDRTLALSMAQGIMDNVDPAVWLDALPREPPVSLLQQSMGDQILPNQGSELLAAAFGATQVGAVLSEVPGLSTTTEPLVNATGITQFRVPNPVKKDDEQLADLLSIHGFAAGVTPAGTAALNQIRAFIRSVLEGEPVISVPEECVDSSCDFTGG